jgi:hypothetical protein
MLRFETLQLVSFLEVALSQFFCFLYLVYVLHLKCIQQSHGMLRLRRCVFFRCVLRALLTPSPRILNYLHRLERIARERVGGGGEGGERWGLEEGLWIGAALRMGTKVF